MSSSAKYTSDEQLSESWVELVPDPPLATRTTPTPFSITGEREYLRLLREAQRDSTHSSAKHSLASSRRDTPRDSPKSPPNSPNTELSTEDELKGVYINYGCNKERLIYDTVNEASRLVALFFKSVRFAATALPTSWTPTRRRRREEKRGRDSTHGGSQERRSIDWPIAGRAELTPCTTSAPSCESILLSDVAPTFSIRRATTLCVNFPQLRAAKETDGVINGERRVADSDQSSI
ncbi:PREDICTED: uncharacterized protein LOC105617780 [Atta cephalotes]|uniref:Uncharacterized protein n=1 Tax=Atta cephalotes TaxID=12957 RepID=A0A158NB20_ATTCE|nr:PREDICTED: uncharacterized protein LOC105617780 [Atta cephalotes]